MQPIFQREVPASWPSATRFVKRLLLGGVVGMCTAGAVAAVVGARICPRLGSSKADLAQLVAKQYAFEAYPSWAIAHPTRMCPRSLRDLDPYLGRHDTVDPWGHAYYFSCGARAVPKNAPDVWILSSGQDGIFGTADDVRSDR